ncbi:MAG TPA: HAD hydrolase-like protein [Candidatus Eisenbacteria bacterium]|nr:HAD hydrolase-like protein [Candidatus Eisenbacteria bacterium]
MTEPARLVCLDLDGTLTDGAHGPALPGAVEAVRALRERWPVRLVTNTTSIPVRVLTAHLEGLGLLDRPEHLYTPVMVARRVLPERGHDRGILIASESQREDYGWFREDPAGPAVLLASEVHEWLVGDLQPAFRRLLDGAAFYALTRNRYYRVAGEFRLDVGGVAALLAYCGNREPETLGKPSPLLFDAIAREAGVPRESIVMVGDDAEVDVVASVALGMRGVLVKTGKYRPGDELKSSPRPSAIAASIAEWSNRPTLF